MTNLEESSSRGGASRKLVTELELGQSVAGKRRCIRARADMTQMHGSKSAKGSMEMGKNKDFTVRYNQGIMSKFSKCFAKGLKSK